MSPFRRTGVLLRAPPLAGVLVAAAAAPGRTTVMDAQTGNAPPVVRITRPADAQVLRWGSAFRYAITVSDREDGESSSGEIAPHTILLDVEYRRTAAADGRPRDEEAGLTVLRAAACFTCHADKASLVGPSFAAIAERYDGGEETIGRLAGRIRSGSSGTWGALPMPPHRQLADRDAAAAARFIIAQGGRRDRWIYAGAEGVVRIIDRPADARTGTYTLTASYLDNGVGGDAASRRRGEHSLAFVLE